MSKPTSKSVGGHRGHGPMGGGPGAAMIPGQKAKDFKGSFKKLLRYLGK